MKILSKEEQLSQRIDEVNKILTNAKSDAEYKNKRLHNLKEGFLHPFISQDKLRIRECEAEQANNVLKAITEYRDMLCKERNKINQA